MADDLVKDIEETLKACKSKRPYNSLLEINGSLRAEDFADESQRPSKASSLYVNVGERKRSGGEPQPREGDTGEKRKGSRKR